MVQRLIYLCLLCEAVNITALENESPNLYNLEIDDPTSATVVQITPSTTDRRALASPAPSSNTVREAFSTGFTVQTDVPPDLGFCADVSSVHTVAIQTDYGPFMQDAIDACVEYYYSTVGEHL